MSGNPASASTAGQLGRGALGLASAAILPHIGRGDGFVYDMALHPAARGRAATAHVGGARAEVAMDDKGEETDSSPRRALLWVLLRPTTLQPRRQGSLVRRSIMYTQKTTARYYAQRHNWSRSRAGSWPPSSSLRGSFAAAPWKGEPLLEHLFAGADLRVEARGRVKRNRNWARERRSRTNRC